MSETEINRGKLKLVSTLDNFVSDTEGAESKEEYFLENFYKTHALIEGFVYEVIADNVDFYDDIFEMTCDSSGDLHYTLKYYNGGCGFQEAIEYAYDNMINKLNNREK